MVGLKHVATAALMVGIGLSATDAGAVTAYVGRGKATDAGSAVADWIADVTGYSETFSNSITVQASPNTFKANIPLPSATLTATVGGSTPIIAQVGNTMTGTNQGTIGGPGSSQTIASSANGKSITLSGFSAASHAFGFYLQNISTVSGTASVTITLTDLHGTSSVTLSSNPATSSLGYNFAADTNGNGIHTTGNGDQFISFGATSGSFTGGSGLLDNLSMANTLGSMFIGFSNIETATSIAISGTASAKWELGDFFCSTAPSRVVFALDTSVGANSCDTGVPEPASMAILGLGLAGLGAIRRRRKAA